MLPKQIVPGLPFIHPSERDLLNKVCRLGTFYMQLREFISEQNTTIFCLVPKLSPQTTDGGRGRGGGLYLKALALGIDNVLNDYRQSLVKLEQKVTSLGNIIYFLYCKAINVDIHCNNM